MIGIFDSGIGGLAIARAITQTLPTYSYLYLGDTARVPYGNRSPEAIYEFTCQGVDFLFERGCELIILACNTASAQALRRIQQEYLPRRYPGRRVLGVIRPLVEAAARQTRAGRVGVIATRATVTSNAYVRELAQQNPNISVFQSAAPLLVPLIEEGWFKEQETRRIVRYYVRDLKIAMVDTLILGCTHYEVLLPLFQSSMGRRCRVLHSGDIIAHSLRDYVTRHPELQNSLTAAKDVKNQFFVTDYTELFKDNAKRIFGHTMNLSKVHIG